MAVIDSANPPTRVQSKDNESCRKASSIGLLLVVPIKLAPNCLAVSGGRSIGYNHILDISATTYFYLCESIDCSMQSEVEVAAIAHMDALMYTRYAFKFEVCQFLWSMLAKSPYRDPHIVAHLEERFDIENDPRANEVIGLGIDQARCWTYVSKASVQPLLEYSSRIRKKTAMATIAT
jgi:hypothetical protein